MLVSICCGSIRSATLRYLVDSVLRQQHTEWELVICTQGEDPLLKQEIARVTALDPRVRAIHIDKFGRSRAMNAAAAASRGDAMAFTDDDCEVASDWLATLVQCFQERPDVGIVAGDLLAPPLHGLSLSTCPATATIECIYRPSDHGFAGPPGFYWGGANFAVRRAVLEKVGPFDENLGVGTEFACAEDTDFCIRAEMMDVVMWTTPRAKVFHTYGRRFGLENVLKHHRGYALGSGALIAKLGLTGHRLGREWGPPHWGGPRGLLGMARAAVRPTHLVRDLYRARYMSRGYNKFLADYELAPGGLSRRKDQAPAARAS